MINETYQDYHTNVLKVLSDNKVYKSKDIKTKVKSFYPYTDEDLSYKLSSGVNLINNNINWSITYLFKAKAIDRIKRGQYQITDRGKKLLKTNETINNNILKQFPEFLEYIGQSDNSSKSTEINESDSTPTQLIENNFKIINDGLSDELLDSIKNSSPEFFENLVVDLLLNMGYGGSREDAGRAIGKSGDEGIDGIINDDVLGLDSIYIQAKRWKNVIGRPEVQKFAGALVGQKASKGVFITTSKFTKAAIEYVNKINSTIILIDGFKLTQLMIRYNVGVSVEATYEIKKMDSDYFDEI